MSGAPPARGSTARGVEVVLPFAGPWLVRNSPARRVPSHGSDLFGERYAIDFIAVDGRRRTADVSDWRTYLATEQPERFFAFGSPILAPADCTVVYAHDREPDHEARRSQLALVPYALGQASRLRRGVGAIAGNHVVLSLADGSGFVALVHLQAGSVQVRAGERLRQGQRVARCGNSGNSTQPHLHMQAMDTSDLSRARGIPLVFCEFRERPARSRTFRLRESGVPDEGSVVESTASPEATGS